MNTQTAEFVRNNREALLEARDQYQALLARSATDADFRHRLLAFPRDAVSEFYGKEVPDTVNIVFVENTADATIVLPDPIGADGELSEADLEAVAGGATTSPLCSAIAIIALTLWAYDEFIERD